MEQPSDRPGNTGSREGSGDPPPLIPLWQEMAILTLKAERLMSAALQAIEAGDQATAARMVAEAHAASKEAIAFAERARAQ